MAVQRPIEEKAYSFFKYKETDEVHIFEGKFLPERCNAELSSICGKVEDRNTENTQIIKACLNEDEARKKAAEIGRSVCGICVSHLYTTYKE